MTEFDVALADARDPLVLALDVGSTGTRGALYDATGLPVTDHRYRLSHAFVTDTDGTAVVDPLAVVAEVDEILGALARPELRGRIAGIALDTFASSIVGVDAEGTPLTPCFTYADSRPARQVEALRAELDEAVVQERTGTRLHTSYLPARLRWLRETQPNVVARVDRWLSLGEVVLLHLTGEVVVGTSTAAWTGLLDRRTGAWDPEMLAVAGIGPERLAPVHHPDAPLTGLSTRWAALEDTAWFPVIADGYAASTGIGATAPGTMAASLATSGAMRVRVPADFAGLPAGLWCYRVDAGYSLLGGALNDVGRAVTWLTDTLRVDRGGLGAALAGDVDARTPLALPFLTGERSTGWAAGARAVWAGISAGTTAPALARGMLEGVALSFGRLAEQMTSVAGRPQEIRASGRVSQDFPQLLQVLADVLDAPVTPVTIKRSTLRGTAVHALDVLAPDVPRAVPTTGPTLEPTAAHREYYDERRARFAELYDAVVAGT